MSVTSNTYFVAHSLGCITTLRYLQTVAAPIGGVVLVSGFDQPIPDFSFLDEFTATPPNYKLLSRTIPNRAVVSAIDDPIVPHEFSRSFAERFDAVFYETKTGRHYLDVDGVTTLPIVARCTVSHDGIVANRIPCPMKQKRDSKRQSDEWNLFVIAQVI